MEHLIFAFVGIGRSVLFFFMKATTVKPKDRYVRPPAYRIFASRISSYTVVDGMKILQLSHELKPISEERTVVRSYSRVKPATTRPGGSPYDFRSHARCSGWSSSLLQSCRGRVLTSYRQFVELQTMRCDRFGSVAATPRSYPRNCP